jgi:hypothetical protein
MYHCYLYYFKINTIIKIICVIFVSYIIEPPLLKNIWAFYAILLTGVSSWSYFFDETRHTNENKPFEKLSEKPMRSTVWPKFSFCYTPILFFTSWFSSIFECCLVNRDMRMYWLLSQNKRKRTRVQLLVAILPCSLEYK